MLTIADAALLDAAHLADYGLLGFLVFALGWLAKKFVLDRLVAEVDDLRRRVDKLQAEKEALLSASATELRLALEHATTRLGSNSEALRACLDQLERVESLLEAEE